MEPTWARASDASSSSDANTAGFSSYSVIFALGGAGALVVGLTATNMRTRKQLQVAQHKAQRRRVSEMVTPPSMV